MPVLQPIIQAQPKPRFIDKNILRKKLAEVDTQTGFVPVPDATAEMSQRLTTESMRTRGIEPDTIYCPQDDDR